MKQKKVVIAVNYADFKDPEKKKRQEVAMTVLGFAPDWVQPMALGFKGEATSAEQWGIPTYNVLERNSLSEIGNTRNLPYIKEVLDLSCGFGIDKIGYMNSDILIGKEFFEAIQGDFDAFIFSRSDIAETNYTRYLKDDFRVIYGGDRHIGADGFFFNKDWWIKNEKHFPDDLILGETDWDTCYRKLIKRHSDNYLEKRVLHHVYHDADWGLTSQGAKNNIRILGEIS